MIVVVVVGRTVVVVVGATVVVVVGGAVVVVVGATVVVVVGGAVAVVVVVVGAGAAVVVGAGLAVVVDWAGAAVVVVVAALAAVVVVVPVLVPELDGWRAKTLLPPLRLSAGWAVVVGCPETGRAGPKVLAVVGLGVLVVLKPVLVVLVVVVDSEGAKPIAASTVCDAGATVMGGPGVLGSSTTGAKPDGSLVEDTRADTVVGVARLDRRGAGPLDVEMAIRPPRATPAASNANGVLFMSQG